MFCVVCSVRYSNSKLMHVGHQYMADNFDPKTLNGLLEFKTFHLTPDKGLGIFTFDNQENLKKHLSDIKNFNKDYLLCFRLQKQENGTKKKILHLGKNT